jgi:hypothetical protein
MKKIIKHDEIKLKKEGCCCGATKTFPCVCMILGSDCSSKQPKCLCFKLLDKQLNMNKKKKSNKKKFK